MNFIQKGKRFVKKHQKGILFTGGAILGVLMTAAIYRSKKNHVIFSIPEGLYKWKNKCDRENLLYESGLPIFADAEQTKVYSDAITPGYEQDLIDYGFEIIERE